MSNNMAQTSLNIPENEGEGKKRLESPPLLGGISWKLYLNRHTSVLPGFNIALGITLLSLSVIVLFPLSVLLAKASTLGVGGLWGVLREPRVISALWTSFSTSFFSAFLALGFGGLVAWVLTRYQFFGKKILDAIVDLPFALPTAVAGIAFATIYAPNGWVGAPLAGLGIQLYSNRIGIVIPLIFLGIPFVVRAVEPLILDLEQELEEASASLGASRFQTFRYVLLPALTPALLTGFILAFARGTGEYGSVIFISNIPYFSEIAPSLIVVRLEEYDFAGAIAIATIMLLISFTLLLSLNFLQNWNRKRFCYV